MFLKIILILARIAEEILFHVLAQALLGQPSQALHKRWRAFLAFLCTAEPFAADWVLCRQRLLPAVAFTRINFVCFDSLANE